MTGCWQDLVRLLSEPAKALLAVYGPELIVIKVWLASQDHMNGGDDLARC